VRVVTDAVDPVTVFLKYVHPNQLSSAEAPPHLRAYLPESASKLNLQQNDPGETVSIIADGVPSLPATPQTLPSLPAKLLLWHIIHKTHYVGDPSAQPRHKVVRAGALATAIFVALPMIIRGIYRVFDAMDWKSALVLAFLWEQAGYYFVNTLSFVLTGVLDHSRRLNMATSTYELIGM
jgi:hypothetical protein